MNDEFYRKALESAQQELATLQTQRAEIEARIARLRETVVSLANLLGEAASETSEVAGMGFSEAVAKVLRLSGKPLTPAQIRDELVRMGYDLSAYKDTIANIASVLKRLHEKGHVDIGTSQTGGRKLYVWSPIQPLDDKGNLNPDYIMNLAIDMVGATLPGSSPKPPNRAEQRRKYNEMQRKKKE